MCWNWRAPAPTSKRSSACTADPAVPKADRDTFEAEMEAADAKWQMTVFGHLLHSFTEEESNVPGIAKFDPGAARQCFKMVDDFVTAAFDGKL